ncbi:hypothetical protein ING2E5A_2741 [Petrimonas mucosa]|uniref:Uncharacterized protein n=1 Tax=Petrimonas mucosa TaxID=1642646 RepID=A0A1G4GAG1_9BACT|nr:hypothetical protein ING2E5A_2741 [Petrimonas mucosa]
MIIKMNGVKEQEVDTVARYSIEEELQIISINRLKSKSIGSYF